MRLADLRSSCRPIKVSARPRTYNCYRSIWFQQRHTLFIHTNTANFLRHPVLQDARHEHQRSSQPVPLLEMRIRDRVLEVGNRKESAIDHHAIVEGVFQRRLRVSTVIERRKAKLPHNRQPRARATHRHSAIDQSLHRLAHRARLPKLHIFGLVSPGDEQGFRLANCLRDERIVCGFGAGNAQRRHRILFTEFLDVRVVVVVVLIRTGGENQEIAAARFIAEKFECCVLISPTAHQRVACDGFRFDIFRISGP